MTVPPWGRIAVGTPEPVFEPRPPGPYAFDHPDTACDGWSTDRFALRLASVRGSGHRYYGRPRQDAARATAHPGTGSVVFAVADGVSSAAEAEYGATEACRAAVERLLHLLEAGPGPLDLASVVTHAAERLRELARWRLQSADPAPAEVAGLYATTLVAGAVRPGPEGARVELCRVGDSGAWLLDRAEGGYLPLFTAKNAPEAVVVSQTVSPLPRVPDQLEQLTAQLAAPDLLLVGTDGFGDPLGDGDGQVGAHFTRALATPPPPLGFGHLLDFSRETFDDDRTLLAVWPEAGPR
ncbi:protein phosphatase 2C domain-containing protein [Kitasatospora sp. NPDC002227]|uniref:protein phosphatase 2C domain-containing protein n=1 Tax=Kitasatospora sp. NPDC002227 TaxID=3154773 RepID=UPI003321F925